MFHHSLSLLGTLHSHHPCSQCPTNVYSLVTFLSVACPLAKTLYYYQFGVSIGFICTATHYQNPAWETEKNDKTLIRLSATVTNEAEQIFSQARKLQTEQNSNLHFQTQIVQNSTESCVSRYDRARLKKACWYIHYMSYIGKPKSPINHPSGRLFGEPSLVKFNTFWMLNQNRAWPKIRFILYDIYVVSSVVTHSPLHPLTSLTCSMAEVFFHGVLGKQTKWPGATTSKSYVSLTLPPQATY